MFRLYLAIESEYGWNVGFVRLPDGEALRLLRYRLHVRRQLHPSFGVLARTFLKRELT